jgi:hypothetical protein
LLELKAWCDLQKTTIATEAANEQAIIYSMLHFEHCIMCYMCGMLVAKGVINYKGRRWKLPWCKLRYSFGICLEGLRKAPELFWYPRLMCEIGIS